MELYCGDSLEITKTFADSSIDTIITDPPYGLKFMGKEWDHGVPGVEFWKEFLRVAKPGAILMAFGGTRTFHRLTVAIEDAGWEIRDCMMRLYGSGFPKSHDISKAIDKELGADREVVAEKVKLQSYGYVNNNTYGSDIDRNNIQKITAPNTDQAKEWDGWGTALKPAWEPIIIAMKPLDGTFANNAVTHGVAGLHIDAGRIGTEQITVNGNGNVWVENGRKGLPSTPTTNTGRFPANIILDEDSAEMLDEQSGISKSSASEYNFELSNNNSPSHVTRNIKSGIHFADKGGASRFFYCAKASKKERGDFNNHPTVKPISLLEYLCKLTETPTGGIVFDPFMGSGSTGIAAKITGRKFIGIDINQEYVDIARKRIESYGKR